MERASTSRSTWSAGHTSSRAFAPQRPALTLAFVGEGPARAELEARAAASGLAARLLLPGARLPREVALWMNASDVVALASHGEGCPGVILEGLSCGRPIVATNVGGIPDLVTPDSGILAPARDPAAFAAALAAAMDREWDPARIAAAHARSWDAVARDLSAILTGVLARR